ncbi:3-hydroxyisobutyrate dehydrogenase [Halomonas cupida]|uniref:3-hydroxyisobutyrate dehydrogenase n=1 Tax=Halomonas cupida TaxID=44933 RepID=A0A1M7CRR5_9GAMM|nr:NAD(P)-dependent oxidoreductase [Halomonas cupida]GEN26075.1 3-hydroxyisobutyrate dehydrogenase [Halomonas cupida]SHL69870.1 3-hydroxyisobutyrate dehydrogenase [Halomonas cupida]
MSSKQQWVGMVGVGLMGHGIASSLQRHGWSLNFLEHPGNQPVEDLISRGATAYSSGAALAADSDVIILCVTGTPQVEDVLFSDGGVLEGLRTGRVVIDCSTAIPSSTLRIAEAVEAAGGRFLDAPMTRTPKEAAEGRLNLIVGGDRELFEAQLPLLQSYAENITHAGPVGSGHKLKLLHNFVSIGFSTVLAEAAACAEQGGIEAEVLVDVLAQGGGAGTVLERLRPYILARDDSGFRFSISNAHKDLGYYLAMARDTNATQSAAAGIHQVLEDAQSPGHAHSTVPELVSILTDQARRK